MSARDSHPGPEQLAAFDAGALAPSERESVERHVASCERCCRALDGLPETPFTALVRAYAASPACESTAVGEPGAGAPDSAWPIPRALQGHPRYRVLGPLAGGGMGVVYKVVHLAMDRLVALKVVRPDLASRADFVERFRREVKAVARLSHPHIVTAYDADQAGELHFLVLEYVEGVSLAEHLQSGPLPVAEAAEYIRQAALGLQHAFERGIVHRDIKPANLLLTGDGQVKIADFGLARLASTEEQVTPEGALVGTPDYTAPEQARAPERVDIRADLYSLGCTLYHLLAGRPPFPEGTPLRKLLARQDGSPRPIRELRSEVPDALVALLDALLARDPARRPGTPAEVADALARFLQQPAAPPRERAPRSARRAGVGLLALLGLAGLALTIFLAWPARSTRDPGDVVEIPPVESPDELLPMPHAASSQDILDEEGRKRQQQTLRAQALTWLREHNRWSPDAPLVAQTIPDLDDALARHDGAQINLGSRLLRAGRPAILAVHPGGFFLFELDPGQESDLGIKPTARQLYSYRAVKEQRRSTPRVLLSDLVIEKVAALPWHQKITGSVRYRFLRPLEGRLFLRLIYYPHPGRVRCSGLHHLRPPPTASEGELTFTFPPLDETEILREKLVVVYLELASRAGEQVVIESNTLARLARIADAPK